jgi:electron transfer flavoprotein beta subunit
MDPASRRLDRSGDTELNPRDRPAVEAALRLREAGSADEVVLVSVGPERAADSLREGLAMGADRGLLLSDARAAGSDILATSLLLARLLERERPRLTLFGQIAGDSEGAVLWSAVGRRLGQPALSQAAELWLEAGYVLARRLTEGGRETVRAPLPCIVSITDACQPRFPSFREMKAAQAKPIELLDLDSAGLDPALTGPTGSRTEVLGVARPPAPERTPLILSEDDAVVERTLAFLTERGLV